MTAADLAWRMNEYDEYAVEQAVQLKEQVKDADLTVLCIGPDRVKETMKKALAMGCDRGVHIADDDAICKDPFEIAAMIAEFARDKGFDLIFTGMQSQDRGSAQVGVMVAELLGHAGVSPPLSILPMTDGTITVKRELEGGIKAVVKASTAGPGHLPARPQHPALPDPAQHHEGQEERTADSSRSAICSRSTARQETAKIVLPGEEGRRPGA